ncbi:pyridine nucleotide-disulfide oxidoreductase domain-containing 1 [Chlorella sorokiniana]|uniref:Pyridine nucleotide-disulfide oxidoreductase domain-containing 1 n=1 Tax=Chlorella sorokiniana TaxID=3076 RepID=A0A2P6TU32_CHLSO|nr:pyridine nucleotide-disulfide oxidoreductase domain-containing 1 [Chlorella sorokiniana]|eukprot:PRW57580.1 pyridine nucleotide-disulfide oxidoreductase domain-containing 1 [Chlorella sorokiniana]
MRFVVVGGGVAGVCCAEELCRLRPQDEVTLVSASRVLKGVSVVARLSRNLEELALVERRLDELPYSNLRLVQDVAAGIDTEGQALLLGGGGRLPYDKLCICAGARPKELPPSVFHASGEQPAGGVPTQQAPQAQQADRDAELAALRQRVLTIRDTDSVARLAARLRRSRRVVVVGNGGIALELISGLKGADVTWVMKHAHIGDAYFDLDAAQFLLEELQHQRRVAAAAAAAAADGGLRVNRQMQSSDPAIYAAGDSASCQWAADESRHWFQMRLWSQARAMGVYAAHCMAGVQDQTGSDMAFELFTHVTRFLGKKVVLLGLYNGQRLGGEAEQDVVTYSRIDEEPEGRSFVRVLLLRGRVQGAVLIGETDLDETLENLIMDQLDVGSYGPHLLDPDVELDHVFD